MTTVLACMNAKNNNYKFKYKTNLSNETSLQNLFESSSHCHALVCETSVQNTINSMFYVMFLFFIVADKILSFSFKS